MHIEQVVIASTAPLSRPTLFFVINLLYIESHISLAITIFISILIIILIRILAVFAQLRLLRSGISELRF